MKLYFLPFLTCLSICFGFAQNNSNSLIIRKHFSNANSFFLKGATLQKSKPNYYQYSLVRPFNEDVVKINQDVKLERMSPQERLLNPIHVGLHKMKGTAGNSTALVFEAFDRFNLNRDYRDTTWAEVDYYLNNSSYELNSSKQHPIFKILELPLINETIMNNLYNLSDRINKRN